ncbi:vesicle transport protein GOT1-like [Impatiens glandulifera]|uniref:vesicle transport protein GOT1-like n=1 Tax=Impatiens glandulifera TaxID=253017 RepID=UPI001FB08AD8|nr:vesicle transport protein GOT1-like [Impatiens glandulifera]
MISVEASDVKKIGLGLTGCGVLFTLMGILFLFDKGYIAIGNILFISGVTLTIGVKSTVQFFTKCKNFKGSISYGVGFLLVLLGWPMIGMIVETYGFIILFSGFWLTIAAFLQRLPIVGLIFRQPVVTSFFEKSRGKRVPV